MESTVLEKVQQCAINLDYLQSWEESFIAEELGSTSQASIKLSQQIHRVVIDVVWDMVREERRLE